MNISVFGLGYVGCVSLGCLANLGNKVIGVDVNEIKVKLINEGKPTIIEHEIGTILEKVHKNGKISATSDFLSAVRETDISLICVGTPALDNGNLNLEQIYQVANQIALGIKSKLTFHTIVIRSTIIPGTIKKLIKQIENISEKKSNIDFGLVVNPEFLREGSAVRDFFHPPFTLIGSTSKSSLKIIKEMYTGLDSEIIETTVEISEIYKYVNNTFHALKVSFANEVGRICNKLGINSLELMDIFVKDKQLNISPYYLRPGFSYGGSCLPKDLSGLKTLAQHNEVVLPIVNNIELSNKLHKELVVEKIRKLDIKKIGILGISFKAGTDDVRNSPIIEVIEKIYGNNYQICIYDEKFYYAQLLGANKTFIDKHIPHIVQLLNTNLNDVFENSDLLILVNNDKNIINSLLRVSGKKILDLVGVEELKYTDNIYEGLCW